MPPTVFHYRAKKRPQPCGHPVRELTHHPSCLLTTLRAREGAPCPSQHVPALQAETLAAPPSHSHFRQIKWNDCKIHFLFSFQSCIETEFTWRRPHTLHSLCNVNKDYGPSFCKLCNCDVHFPPKTMHDIGCGAEHFPARGLQLSLV